MLKYVCGKKDRNVDIIALKGGKVKMVSEDWGDYTYGYRWGFCAVDRYV